MDLKENYLKLNAINNNDYLIQLLAMVVSQGKGDGGEGAISEKEIIETVLKLLHNNS